MSEIKYFYVNDVSGSPIVGASGFSTVYLADGNAVSGSAVTVSEISGGLYKVNMSIVPEGELLLQMKHANTGYFIAPSFHEWTKDSTYTTDDVYGRLIVATSTTSLPIIPSQRYVTVQLNAKEADDIQETLQVPARFRPLTGWTNISIQAYPAERLLNSSTPALSGTYDVDVINATDGVIDILIGKNVTQGIVPNGVSSVNIYADVQGDDPSGYRKTMVELNISVKRDFNTL